MLEEELIDLVTLINFKELNQNKIKDYIYDIAKNYEETSQNPISSKTMDVLQDVFDEYALENHDHQKQFDFIMGQLSFIFLLEKCKKEKEIKKEEFKLCSLIKNCTEIIKTIHESPGITQENLIKHMDITEKQLHDLVNETEFYRLFYIEDSEGINQYHLTSLGLEYYKCFKYI